MDIKEVKILGGKYTIRSNGEIINTKSHKIIYPHIDKKGYKTVKLYNRITDPQCTKLIKYSLARLLYYSFHQELDENDKSYIVLVRDNKTNFTLEDLYIEKRKNID